MSLLAVLTGCHKPQAREVIGATEAAIKATALASISAKYPDVKSSDLKFNDLSIRAMANGKEEIYVSYELPATAKTTTDGKKTTTTVKTIGIGMSLAGKVDNVYKSTRSNTTY